MALKVRAYDAANYLESREAISRYLSDELEANEPPYPARALSAVIRARGGVERLAAETGVAVEELERAASAENRVERDTIFKVILCFQSSNSDTRVA